MLLLGYFWFNYYLFLFLCTRLQIAMYMCNFIPVLGHAYHVRKQTHSLRKIYMRFTIGSYGRKVFFLWRDYAYMGFVMRLQVYVVCIF